MRTKDEYDTMAALLGDGWEYDDTDHTMCKKKGAHDLDMYDPDTMEYLGGLGSWRTWCEERKDAMARGEIGVADKIEDELR